MRHAAAFERALALDEFASLTRRFTRLRRKHCAKTDVARFTRMFFKPRAKLFTDSV